MKPSRAPHSTGASGSSRYCLASSLPWRSRWRWSASSASSLTVSRIAVVSAAAGIVIGLAVDSFLGAILAHWMQNTFAAGSLIAAAALLGLSALLACLLPARHAMAVSPAEALRYE